MDFLHTFFYFVITIGVLVSFHEFGHFWTARKVGVKVLRFSVGFGKVLWSYQKNQIQQSMFYQPSPWVDMSKWLMNERVR